MVAAAPSGSESVDKACTTQLSLHRGAAPMKLTADSNGTAVTMAYNRNESTGGRGVDAVVGVAPPTLKVTGGVNCTTEVSAR